MESNNPLEQNRNEILRLKNHKEDIMMEAEKTESCKTVGKDVRFERIRRITGYLVGTTDRFNDAKRCEEKDRVKHGL